MAVFRHSGTTNIASTSGGASNNFTLNGEGDVLKVSNTSNLDAFIKTGVGSQTATSADFYIAPNTEVFFQIGFADDSIAIATPNTPTGLYVMRGSAR